MQTKERQRAGDRRQMTTNLPATYSAVACLGWFAAATLKKYHSFRIPFSHETL
jgi:hypothetical protein